MVFFLESGSLGNMLPKKHIAQWSALYSSGSVLLSSPKSKRFGGAIYITCGRFFSFGARSTPELENVLFLEVGLKA